MRRLAPFHTLTFAFVALFAASASASAQTLPSPTFGNLTISIPTPTLNTTNAAGGLTNGILLSGAGNYISYCPVLSCLTSPTSDHQRASALFWATTSDDGHSEEQTVAIETIVGTGYSKAWATNTAYSVGDNVSIPAINAVYRVTTAGTSASSGTGPTGTGSGIVDGTVVWAWINASAINGKVGLYNEESVVAGGGQSWVQANNVTLQPGMIPTFNINTEYDLTNNAADCAIGVANCNALEIKVAGTHQSTQGIHLTSTNAGSVYGSIWGIRLNGTKLASNADIEVDSSAAVGLGFNASGLGGTHSTAAIKDATTSPVSLLMTGTYSTGEIYANGSSAHGFITGGTKTGSDVWLPTNGPIALDVSGTRSVTAIRDNSTTPSGAIFQGTYSLGEVYANGVSASGFITGGTKTRNDAWLPTNAPIGVEISGTRSTSAIRDSSTTPSGAIFQGTYSLGEVYANGVSAHGFISGGTKTGSDVWLPTSGPIAIDISGTRSITAIKDSSTTPIGATLQGTYSGAAISTTAATTSTAVKVADGQSVCFSSTDACVKHSGGKVLYIVGGVNMFSVADTTGNAIFKGTVTPSGTP